MARDDEYEQDDAQDQDDYQEDEQTEDDSESDDGEQALADAAPHEVDAHRNLIGDVLGHLDKQGVDTQELADQAGVQTTDPEAMSHGDLVSMARTLAQEHPEVLQAIADRYPQAGGILETVLGTGGSGGGGLLGGLVGKLFGR